MAMRPNGNVQAIRRTSTADNSTSADAASSGTLNNKQKDLKRRLQQVLKSPGNKKCCDCHDRRPTWASFVKPHDGSPPDSRPLVSFICYQCASLHRKLGTHICHVRSVSLDDWPLRDVEGAELSGNDVVNDIYEADWERVHQENPAAEISRPVHGAHGATVERFIRQKYEARMFYNKTKHYEHNDTTRNAREASMAAAAFPTGSTPKSPSVRKRLGAFFAQSLSPLGGAVSKLSGARTVSEGATEESTVSDNKSFFSVPARVSGTKDKRKKAKDSIKQHQHHHRRQHGNSRSQSDVGGNACSKPASLPLEAEEWLDTQVGLSGSVSNDDNDDDNCGDTKFISDSDIKTTSTHSDGSNGAGKLKKPQSHVDPRRTEFHNSRSGCLNLSDPDLDFSGRGMDLGESKGNLKSVLSTPKRPKLVSTSHVSNPSPHNSLMNLYTQKNHTQGRSRSVSRSRDSIADGLHECSRSKSMLRDGDRKGDGQRRTVGRSRSRGPKSEELRSRYGRSRSTSRTRDGQDGIITAERSRHQRTTRRQSERHGRSRSTIRDRDIVAGDMLNGKRQGRSTSRVRSSSKAPDDTGKKNDYDRRRSLSRVRRSKSEDLSGLAKMTHLMNETAREEPRPLMERFKSDDLTGMVLMLDDSTNELLYNHDRRRDKREDRGKKRVEESRIKSKSREECSSRDLNDNDDDERPMSSRSRRSSKYLQEDDDNCPLSGRICRSSKRVQDIDHDEPPMSGRSRDGARSDHPHGENESRQHAEVDDTDASPIKRVSRKCEGNSQNVRDSTRSIERISNHSHSMRDERTHEFLDRDGGDALKPLRRGKRDIGSDPSGRNSTRSIRSYLRESTDNYDSCSRSFCSSISFEKKGKEENHECTPSEQSGNKTGRRLAEKPKALKARGSSQKTKDPAFSPGNSGENDFHVIAAKPFTLGQGSDHSFGDPSNFHRSFSRDVEKDRFTRDTRRSSRERMINIERERKARKSDIFASLDREENEASANQGPLVGGLQSGLSRSKSGVGTKLMIRAAPPKRSKSSEGVMFKSKPDLALGVELGKGSSNDALMKAWKAKKEENEKFLAQMESSVLR